VGLLNDSDGRSCKCECKTWLQTDHIGRSTILEVLLDGFEPVSGWPIYSNLFRTKSAPLSESGGTVKLEIVTAVERAFLIEMVVDGGMNGDDFLQTSHAAEPFHGSLRSSKRKVGLLSPIVQPASSFPHAGIADLLHRRTVGLHLVGHQYIRAAVSLH
jgi:hypothetical protein